MPVTVFDFRTNPPSHRALGWQDGATAGGVAGMFGAATLVDGLIQMDPNTRLVDNHSYTLWFQAPPAAAAGPDAAALRKLENTVAVALALLQAPRPRHIRASKCNDKTFLNTYSRRITPGGDWHPPSDTAVDLTRFVPPRYFSSEPLAQAHADKLFDELVALVAPLRVCHTAARGIDASRTDPLPVLEEDGVVNAVVTTVAKTDNLFSLYPHVSLQFLASVFLVVEIKKDLRPAGKLQKGHRELLLELACFRYESAVPPARMYGVLTDLVSWHFVRVLSDWQLEQCPEVKDYQAGLRTLAALLQAAPALPASHGLAAPMEVGDNKDGNSSSSSEYGSGSDEEEGGGGGSGGAAGRTGGAAPGRCGQMGCC